MTASKKQNITKNTKRDYSRRLLDSILNNIKNEFLLLNGNNMYLCTYNSLNVHLFIQNRWLGGLSEWCRTISI